MKSVLVYQGYGMYTRDSEILYRELSRYLKGTKHNVAYITPKEICEGKLQTVVSLLVIGGGFDCGLIKALGQPGMKEIRDFVHSGGSYLGICSGAYFACDYIEFDKGGPLQVVGERYLKFYPGVSTGPLYKTYVYNSFKGAVAALIDFDEPIKAIDRKEHNADVYPTTILKDTAPASDMMEYDSGISRGKEIEHNNLINKTIMNTEADSGASQGKLMCSIAAKEKKVKNLEINYSSKANNKHAFNGKLLSNSPELYEKKSLNSENLICCVKNDTSVQRSSLAGLHETCAIKGNNGLYLDDGSTIYKKSDKLQFKIYFNGGGHFINRSMISYLESQKEAKSRVNGRIQMDDNIESPVLKKRKLTTSEIGIDDAFKNVTILSRYLDLPNEPVAIVKCRVGKGVAVLSGGHFEYSGHDVEKDDNDDEIKAVITELEKNKFERARMFKLILNHLDIQI